MTGENNTDVDKGADDVETTTEGDTPVTTTEGEGNSDKESDKPDGAATDDEDGEDQDDDTDEDAPTRKPRTNADWVALRRQKKIERQEKSKAKAGQGEGEGENDIAEDDDLSDISEEDAKAIERVLNKRLAPFEQQQQKAALETEINQFIAENPDFKPFAAKALKWAQHPSWRDIPTKQLMYAAAGDKLMSIGAKRAKAADEKAQKTRTASGTGGTTTGSKPVWEMSDDEFAKQVEAVKLGQTK